MLTDVFGDVVPGQVVMTKDVRVKVGGNGNLFCSFTGYPINQIEWKNGNQTVEESRYRINKIKLK